MAVPHASGSADHGRWSSVRFNSWAVEHRVGSSWRQRSPACQPVLLADRRRMESVIDLTESVDDSPRNRWTASLGMGGRLRRNGHISDGNEGVQWNAGYYPRDGAAWLGFNLEGMKYDDRLGRATHRMAVLRSAPDQGGEYRPHAGRAGSPRWPGLGGSPARREGVSGPPEATSRPQEGPGHAAPFEAVSVGTTG